MSRERQRGRGATVFYEVLEEDGTASPSNLVAVALLQRVLGGVARVFVEAGDFRPRYQVQQILQSVEGRGVRSSQGGVAEGARGINRPRR